MPLAGGSHPHEAPLLFCGKLIWNPWSLHLICAHLHQAEPRGLQGHVRYVFKETTKTGMRHGAIRTSQRKQLRRPFKLMASFLVSLRVVDLYVVYHAGSVIFHEAQDVVLPPIVPVFSDKTVPVMTEFAVHAIPRGPSISLGDARSNVTGPAVFKFRSQFAGKDDFDPRSYGRMDGSKLGKLPDDFSTGYFPQAGQRNRVRELDQARNGPSQSFSRGF